MLDRVYINDALDEVTSIVQIILTILAYAFNLILIFIVQTCKKKEIGTYRTLITYFAVSDLYYTTVHIVVYPVPEMHGNAFVMRGHGPYTELFGVGLYAGVYGHAFPILIFHFLYRLLAIKYPEYLDKFPRFLLALCCATLTHNALWFSVMFWFLHPDEVTLSVLAPLFNGSIPLPVVHIIDTATKYSQALYWTGKTFEGPRYRNLIGTGIICSSMMLAYTIIITCSFTINKYLKEHVKSPQSIRIHKQLFRSLLYQSFLPLFTAYFPAGSSLLLPVFGLSLDHISIVTPLACATHPLLDPLLLIFTIVEYRRSFFSMARRLSHFTHPHTTTVHHLIHFPLKLGRTDSLKPMVNS